MALSVRAQFIVGGVAVGNTLTGTCAIDGATRTVTLSGDPGVTVAQAQAAKLRVWVVDQDAGTDVSIYEISPPVVTYEQADLEVQIAGPGVFNAAGAPQVSFSLTANTISGTPTSYSWAEGGNVLGTSATLTTSLPAGPHTITLTVTDAGGDTFTDTVVVVLGMVPASRVFRARTTMG